MGRIKSTLIKRTAKKLLREDNKFTKDFEDNKILLEHHMPSKSLKNKIAGYLARLKRPEKQRDPEKEAEKKREKTKNDRNRRDPRRSSR